MKIDSVKLKNYRQYKGPVEVKFSLDKNKNFTIIRGTNGAGKTNLLNAITWCLYGEELHKSTKFSSGDPIYNKITKNETKHGKKFNVEVEVVFVDDYGLKTYFNRSLSHTCQDNGEPIPSPIVNFTVKNDLGGELERPEFFIDKNLPKDIEEYFFFDGEKLGKYFDKNSGKNIKNSVDEISKLFLLDSSLKRLNSLKSDYTKQIRKLDKNLGKSLGDSSVLEASVRKFKKQISDATHNIEKLDDELRVLKKELRSIDNDDINTLEKEKNKLLRNKKRIEKIINKEKTAKKQFLIKNFYKVHAFPAMRYSCDEFNNIDETDFSEALYSKDLLDHILNENKCLCGCDLSKDSKAHDTLEDLLKKVKNVNISDEVKNTYRDLNVLMLEIESIKDKINSYNETIIENTEYLSEIKEDIESIDFRREKIDETSIRKLNNKISSLESDRDSWISKRTKADISLDETTRKLNIVYSTQKKQESRNKKVIKLKKQLDACINIIKNIEQLRDIIEENIRSNVEKITSEQFKQLMWKNNIDKVWISKDYDVRLIESTGDISSTVTLSAGEKLVLALSFVAALNNISTFELPIIIDTPMGRLGPEMISNIANTFPKYMKNKQVTLLVTDTEYSEDFQKGIKNNVFYEYKIDHTEKEYGSESRIVLNE